MALKSRWQQGIDIPDVLMVVQWKVTTDLNILIQRFGRAARNFALQAVAILIAEPKWFYDEHERKQTRKRKRQQKLTSARKQRSAPNVVRKVEGNHSESDEEHLHGTKTNRDIPGVTPGAADQDVEKCIRAIAVDQKGKSINDSVRFFINAWWLRGRKRCRRFHSNHFYKNDEISECPLIFYM